MEDSPATHRGEEAVLEHGLRRDGSGANDHHSRGGPVPRLGAVREDAPAGGPGPGRAAPRGATGGPRPVDELTNAAGRRGAGLQRRARIRAQPTHSCLRRRAEKIATTRFHQLDIDFGRELAASHKSRGRSHAHGRLLSHVSSHLAGSGLCAVTTTAGDSFPAGMRQTT